MRLLLFLLLTTGIALGCARFVPPLHFADIAEEIALIAWDKDTHTQHFLRQVKFNTEAPDLGFVVPTPTRPEISEADGSIFGFLDQQTRPREVRKPGRLWEVVSFFSVANCSAAPHRAPPPPVDVLEQLQVAGFDVAVLRAQDAQALEDWLKGHGYEFSTESRDWVEPYIKDGFVLSAFKYSGQSQQEDRINSPAIKMSFHSPAPFYPYREPDVQPKKHYHRSLRLYLLGEGRYDGALINVNTKTLGHWSADLQFSAPLEDLPASLKDLNSGTWLSAFNDSTVVRASGWDLGFSLAKDQSEVRPPDRVIYEDGWGPILIEPILLVVWVLVVVIRRRYRRLAESPS